MSGRTYANPVHPGYLGDPFVLKHNGEYYAYGTVPLGEGTVPLGEGTVPLGELTVPVLHSRDLTSWRPLGDALAVRDESFEALWAPEVAYHDGTFYMYYSAGGEEGQGHRLRVATAAHPAGPFEDGGVVLTPDEPFTIDAHPFRDEADGLWYLYYCRDFLDEEGGRVGTGIVVDRLLEMTRLAGEPRTVVRPNADWQLYEAQREWYGRVWDWYTVEGPFVRRHDGRYYCLYSGGAWREPNYGVSFVVADHPLGPFSAEAGAEGPQVLRTRPGAVVGPGHASIVHAPDNLHGQIVYHAWDPGHARRLMRVDRLDWDETGPSSPGPSLDPVPAPPLPAFRDNFDGPDGAPPDPKTWQASGGDWRKRDGELVQHDAGDGPATALLTGVPPAGDYLFEANARLVGGGRGRYGVCLDHGADGRTLLLLAADGSSLTCLQEADPEGAEAPPTVGLPAAGFDPLAYHRLLVRVRGGVAEVWLDGVRVGSGLPTPATTSAVGLYTHRTSAAFDGVALTRLG